MIFITVSFWDATFSDVPEKRAVTGLGGAIIWKSELAMVGIGFLMPISTPERDSDDWHMCTYVGVVGFC